MQSAVPKGEGGMLAILGSDLIKIEKIIEENKNKYECFIANDNSDGQVVASGKIDDIEKFALDLKSNNIKNIKLPVSAPFHCNLMKKATEIICLHVGSGLTAAWAVACSFQELSSRSISHCFFLRAWPGIFLAIA